MLLIRNKTIRLVLGALETFSFLSLKLILQRGASFRSFPGRTYRVYMGLAKRGHWRCEEVLDLFPKLTSSDVRVQLEFTPSAGLAWEIEDLVNLALLTRIIEPRQVFEIGTYRGRTALNFALNAPENCIVYTLDLPPDDQGRAAAAARTNSADAYLIEHSETGIEYRDKPVATKIRQLLGDSQVFDFSSYAGQMDMVFVDGAHHYAAALSDTQRSLDLVRSGGWIIWDDWGNYGDYNDIVRAVLDTLPSENVIQIAGTQLAVYQKP